MHIYLHLHTKHKGFCKFSVNDGICNEHLSCLHKSTKNWFLRYLVNLLIAFFHDHAIQLSMIVYLKCKNNAFCCCLIYEALLLCSPKEYIQQSYRIRSCWIKREHHYTFGARIFLKKKMDWITRFRKKKWWRRIDCFSMCEYTNVQ